MSEWSEIRKKCEHMIGMDEDTDRNYCAWCYGAPIKVDGQWRLYRGE